MKKIIITIAVVFFSACSLLNRYPAHSEEDGPIRRSDLKSWIGIDLYTLEIHPEFSTMKLTKTDLSNGDTLFDYVNTSSVSTHASGGWLNYESKTQAITCHHQFFVRDKKILEYRPIGKCYTDCYRRPSSEGCIDYR